MQEEPLLQLPGDPRQKLLPHKPDRANPKRAPDPDQKQPVQASPEANNPAHPDHQRGKRENH